MSKLAPHLFASFCHAGSGCCYSCCPSPSPACVACSRHVLSILFSNHATSGVYYVDFLAQVSHEDLSPDPPLPFPHSSSSILHSCCLSLLLRTLRALQILTLRLPPSCCSSELFPTGVFAILPLSCLVSVVGLSLQIPVVAARFAVTGGFCSSRLILPCLRFLFLFRNHVAAHDLPALSRA